MTKVYECLIEDMDNVYKVDIAAQNKKQVLDEWGGNGDFIKLTDVTSKYTFKEYDDWYSRLWDCLNGKFNEGEIRLICELVEKQINEVERSK